MPRPKLYRTKQERILANRLKSQKYYQKNAEAIKQKLREDYLAQKREQENLRSKKRRAAKAERAEEQRAQSQKERGDTRILATVQQAKQRYQRLVKEQMKLPPQEYFDRLYHDVINKGQKGDVLKIVDKVLSKEVTIMESFFGEVLQRAGYRDECKCVEKLLIKVRTYHSWVEDMQCAALVGVQELQNLYSKKRLHFQQQQA